METIEEYLKGEFREGKLRLEKIYETLVQIARLFDQSFKEEYQGWYYEFRGQPPPNEKPWYSCSTQAMCALALSRLTTAAFWPESENKEQGLRQRIGQKKESCVKSLCTWLNKNAQQGETLWKSGTYGDKDPLTAAWIIELVSEEPRFLDSLDQKEKVKKNLQGAIHKALKGNYDEIIPVENRAGAHAFPLLRCVLAAKKIKKDSSRWGTRFTDWQRLLSRAGYWFEEALHRQLSHYHFNDFRFDAPELIYCLAGALQTGRLRREDPLIREVLEVIRAAQQRSVYWRPYRPFLVKPQGLVLMPLTVEAADALLDTPELTDRFGQLRGSLSSYYEWLMAQRKPEDSDMIGWCSESAFGPPEVEKTHAWTTSRVAIFLLNYSRLLDRALQSDLLQNSGLSFKDKEAGDLIAWNDIQPMDLGRKKQVMQLIEEHFINSHEPTLKKENRLNPDGGFSMLLYGPPGTSKTTIAEAVASALGLKLVTIPVSDFIVLGEQAVEKRAKVIFDVLGELKNVVVLFDEIDRLIIDRESDRYMQQRDIFQMMTPSMLTKLNDLRRKKRLIIVIATNYFERIDGAIRRPGRIDHHFLIPPFDQKSRVELLKHFICRKFGEKGKVWQPPSDDTRLGEIAKHAPLLIFEELRRVFDRSVSRAKEDVDVLLSNLESEIRRVKPSITIRSYRSKFDDKRLDPEKPYREFFFLCFLLAEVGQANDEIKKFFREQWDEWKKENAPEVDELTSDEWVREQLQKLGVTTDESQPGEEGRKSHT